jgi:membrane protease YdiL (CAAX protease family)
MDFSPYPDEPRDMHWVFVGRHGLRAGWSVLIAVILYRLFSTFLGTIAVGLFPSLARFGFSPTMAIIEESVPLLAMLAAGVLLARIEHRKILDYNLTGPRRPVCFVSGLAAGFAALSALVGALAWGGWLHFGPIALSGVAIFNFGALWAFAFLLVGCVEEGMFRCYLQFTLTRGINFWWALGITGVICIDLFLRSRGNPGIIAFIWMDTPRMLKGNEAWGVYATALLGLVPCLLLHLKKVEGSGFWQAAWVTSTLFGFVHTSNGGENWIGIFAAAAIGFVFCVSVRVTGSAWWAIGCHAAWDWAETYFYGAADSGLPAQGHYLTTSPAGSALWSGGTDGPEGSVLVLGIILLLLVALLVIYGRRKPKTFGALNRVLVAE